MERWQFTDQPVIEASNLHLDFEGVKVLEGIDLSVMPGERMVILGSSGCGKSTLLRTLLRAYMPQEGGSIKIFGREITTMSDEELNRIRKRTGCLFQGGALYNSMTVGDNVALPLREHTELDDNIIRIIVKMKLELVGLRDFEDLRPGQLSGGMAKRVGLARAIALDPEILFYDEPTTGLDPITAGVIEKLINDLAAKTGVTSVIVTQDMHCAFACADRICLLYEGRVAALGSLEEIRNSSDPLVRQFIDGAADGPIPLRMSNLNYAEDLIGGRRTHSGRFTRVKRNEPK
jgi:phospholipid/cholesterol/gamma-HCH transport system ATP-binding protein